MINLDPTIKIPAEEHLQNPSTAPTRRARSYAFTDENPIAVKHSSSKTIYFIPNPSELSVQKCSIKDLTSRLKTITRPISRHSYIKNLNILSFYQKNIGSISEDLALRIINEISPDSIVDSSEYYTLETQQEILFRYIQNTLNIPTKNSSKGTRSINLPALVVRSKSIELLASILIKHLDPLIVKNIESAADFISIFSRLNKNLTSDHTSELSTQSFYDDLRTASTHYKSPFPDFARKIYGWISGLDNLFEVEELDLSRTNITTIPSSICRLLTNIKKLDFQDNDCALPTILTTIENLTTLEELDLSDNKFTDIPFTFFDKLTRLQKINLTNNQFPLEIIDQIRSICAERSIQLSI